MKTSYIIAIALVSIITLSIVFSSPSPSPSLNIPEGTAVVCNDGTGMVYRYTGGQLRYYPNPATWLSWDPQPGPPMNLTPEQCATIPKRNPMEMRR